MSLAFPPIFLLHTNLQPNELHALEEKIPSLTWDAHEAEIILGKITRRERALFELRRLKLRTDESLLDATGGKDEPYEKRQKLNESRATAQHTDEASESYEPSIIRPQGKVSHQIIEVVKLSWLNDSLAQGTILPTIGYVLYRGQKKPSPLASSSNTPIKQANAEPKVSPGSSILKRAAKDNSGISQPSTSSSRSHKKYHHFQAKGSPSHKPPALLHESTTEHEICLPDIPGFLHTSYSCQRPTPVINPNVNFIDQLKEVRTLRLLEGDQVGVRAYSTSIAALSAYPFQLQSPVEICRLPGCGDKIALLYQQWKETGQLSEVMNAAADPRTSVLKLFYDIWGVGDTTSRDFYEKGWRDLDDLVDYGWESLSRVQQIGVKYYDEFQLKISRAEVQAIGEIILAQAHKMNPGFQMTIVGGYRRGKEQSGDVDVVISHPDESLTMHLIEKIVFALEKTKHITHTLTLSTINSDRGQAPLPWAGEGNRRSGFDTLDKALVVWQDPLRRNAPHRRVDIIISPWKTVGCAVMGWSGGTTFQRDLRRYCKKEKTLKFDSSGVRKRTDGNWVDLEGFEAGYTTLAPDMVTAEKRVFESLGLSWIRPEDRCTG